MFFSRLLDPVVPGKRAATKAVNSVAPVDVKAVPQTPAVSKKLIAQLSALNDQAHAQKKAELAEMKRTNPLRYYAIKSRTFLLKRDRPQLLAALKQLATVAYEKEQKAGVVIPKGCDANQTANRLVDILMPTPTAVQQTPLVLRWLKEGDDADKAEFNNRLDETLKNIIHNPALAVAPTVKKNQHK